MTLRIKNYVRNPVTLLLIATILKFVVILSFYQHVIEYDNSSPHIATGYGWDQLVSALYVGKYEMVMQDGLSDIYDFTSYSYRPPIYPLFLFLVTYLSNYSAVVLVFVHSIITSLVAYLGYRIVKLSTKRKTLAIICLWTLFLFPMNFLKSGTIDEAPLMLVFILASLYIFCKFMRNQDKLAFLIFCGVLMGLSTMTRYTTLPIAAGLLLFILTSRAINKKSKSIAFFLFPYILVLSPWILRNYLIYGQPVMSAGSGRVLLFTQSEEFIKLFPDRTVDDIERNYLRSFHKSHAHLSQLDAFTLDKEFKRFAISEAVNSPWKYLRSLTAKLKVFLPYRYFPAENNSIKDIAYILPYSLSLLFFLWSILKSKGLTYESIGLLIALVGLIIPGLVYFMLSRHLYPLIIIMIIFSCISFSNVIRYRPLSADQSFV